MKKKTIKKKIKYYQSKVKSLKKELETKKSTKHRIGFKWYDNQ